MNYQKFLNEIVGAVKERVVQEDYNVRLKKILKNNGVRKDSIMILKEGEKVAPNIYLEYYYDLYCDGISLDTVADEILTFYAEAIETKPIADGEEEDYLNFDKCRNKIFYRIVNFEKNEEFLKNIPHIRYLDLAITFHCLVGEVQHGIQSYCINEQLLEHWNLTKDELYHIAKKNTPLLFPPKISMAEDVIAIMMHKIEDIDFNIHLKTRQEYEKYIHWMIDELSFQVDRSMYVISNLSDVNGAAVLLYPDLLKTLAEKCQENLFLMPLSIHNTVAIAIPNSVCITEELERMVYEVNRTQVSNDDVLSDKVYYYDRNLDKISVADSNRNKK